MASLDFPSSPTNGQTYSSAGITWTYDSTYTVWNVTSSGPVGYSGSQGYTGSKGDIGYSGSLGYTGSAGTNGTNGYNGSQGYTGSASTVVGYTGSKGDIGYTGSAGTNGTNGYTGSAGTTGYTGSLGYSGSAATINWMYKTANYTAVNNDGILADTTSASFTVTLPASPATGTYVSIVDVTSTFATNPLTVAGNGETLQGLTYTSVVLNVTSAKVDLIYEGAYWAVATTSGTRGYTGSSGAGYTGSASTVVGYTGSLGYVGSQGYVGSAGYTGSVGYAGSSGYTGSLGYTGSAGTNGYTGSLGYSGSGATGVNWTNKSTTYTAVNNDGIIANTSGGSFTVTLPASPSTGSYVVFLDGNSSFATYPLTVDGNGNNIADSYSTSTLNITNSKVEFIYNGSTWEIATSTGTRGYSGSVGYTGSLGYTGSQGYTGSASTVIGYTGSKGDIGYTGSIPAAITATSLALGGATLGTNNLAVTGTTQLSGILGIGITPSAWGTFNAAQVGLLSIASYTNGDTNISSNLYYNAGWKYIGTGRSAKIQLDSSTGGGDIKFFVDATGGTAGGATAGSEAARFDSSGNLLVGTTSASPTSPTARLTVAGNISTTWGDYFIGTTYGGGGYQLGIQVVTNARELRLETITGDSSGVITFYPGAGTTERARIDSSGRLGIGMTPSNVLDITKTQNAASLIKILNTNASGSALVGFQSQNASHTADFQMLGTGYTPAGMLLADMLYLHTDGAGGMAIISESGGIKFGIGGYSYTEAARIDTSGNLLINTTAVTQQEKLRVNFAGNTNQGITISDSANYNNSQYVNFWTNGAVRGSVTNNGGTGVLYNVTSDQRLKTNVSDAAPASALIDAIQVRQFDWKVDNSHQRYGMVAQELLEVAPEAVSVPTDPEQMMGVDYSKLVPMLIKEVQSLRTRLAALEAK